MGEARHYRVADLVLRLQVAGEHIGFGAEEWKRWAPFQCEPGQPDIHVEIEEADDVHPPGLPEVVDARPFVEWSPGEPHRLYRWGFDILVDESRAAICRRYVSGSFNILDAALRLPVALVMARRSSGFLLHASAVAGPDGAVVLIGPPGAGKSTAAGNRPAGSELLSDEVVAVYWKNGQPTAASTPFGGDYEPSGRTASLRQILRIEKGQSNEVIDLDVRSGAGELLYAAILAVKDPELLSSALRMAERLARSVRLARLRCVKDGSFWPGILYS